MTSSEFQNLLLLANRMISSREPRKAEYGRGYGQGIRFHFNNPQFSSPPDHKIIADIARIYGSQDVHSYIRGYCDGRKGLKPEDIP
jgi:hypothetical protein